MNIKPFNFHSATPLSKRKLQKIISELVRLTLDKYDSPDVSLDELIIALVIVAKSYLRILENKGATQKDLRYLQGFLMQLMSQFEMDEMEEMEWLS